MANNLLTEATAAGNTGATIVGSFIDKMSVQSFVVGTGAVSSTVVVEGSNNGVDWVTISTLNMTGATRAADGGVLQTFFQQIRARVSAISGTGAKVSVDYISR